MKGCFLMHNLFNKNIPPSCAYCSRGKSCIEKETILCIKHGVVESTYSCKKFKYDPLKRAPKKHRPIASFSKKDFSI